MVLEILCVEHIYPRYSGVLVLRYCFFRCLAAKVLNKLRKAGQDCIDAKKSDKNSINSLLKEQSDKRDYTDFNSNQLIKTFRLVPTTYEQTGQGFKFQA